MSIIKQEIKNTGNDVNLKISLGLHDNFTGYQQEIDSLTQFTALDSVNPVIDPEERKFKLSQYFSPTIYFYFYNNLAVPQYNTYFPLAGFSLSDITEKSSAFLNSFFILDFYDTYDINTQTKIFTTYLTKLGSNQSMYSITSGNQLYYWYLPVSYTTSQTGSTIYGYVKFSFFNAKTGKVILFYNQDNATLSTPEKLFFKAQLNLISKTWSFITTNLNKVNAYQIINNSLYLDKVNNTYDTFNNLQQTFPNGNTFIYTGNTANYINYSGGTFI